MNKVRIMATEAGVWVYPEGQGDEQYTVLVGSNLDVHSFTATVERMEEIKAKFADIAPEVEWHDMREGAEKPSEEAQVIVYDDADEFLSDWLSADDQIHPRD